MPTLPPRIARYAGDSCARPARSHPRANQFNPVRIGLLSDVGGCPIAPSWPGRCVGLTMPLPCSALRDRALRWRADANARQDSTSRMRSIELADQFARLAAILENAAAACEKVFQFTGAGGRGDRPNNLITLSAIIRHSPIRPQCQSEFVERKASEASCGGLRGLPASEEQRVRRDIMLGLMQNRPLLISSLIDYAAAWHGHR